MNDALCYDLDANTKLLVYKSTISVNRCDLEDLFERKEYRARSNITIVETEPVRVIDGTMCIVLLIENGVLLSIVINFAKSIMNKYVSKIRLRDIFKLRCIKYLCESMDSVLYAYLIGYNDPDLIKNQYTVINRVIRTSTEFKGA